MRHRVTRVAAALVLLACCSSTWASSTAQCEVLERTDFAQIQDAPTQIMHARNVEPVDARPAHCHVQGYVWPQVGFELRLPISRWNGKFIEIGTGGYAGSTRFVFLTAWCEVALQRGYACIVSDLGHASSADGTGIAGSDALWGYNNLQAELDWGIRAAHVVAVSGKAITRHYYGSEPKFSYFLGSSGGGRQGLMEAQRFPWDFDGIVLLDPSDLTTTSVVLLWNALALSDAQGNPLLTPADFKVLNEAALARCDTDDGVADKVISDPRRCDFDAAELLCRRGRQSGCLSQPQIDAVRKVYSGPVTKAGERLFPGALPGSETGSMFSPPLIYKVNWWRYLGFTPDPGPKWQARDFDFDADYKRLGMMGALHGANNPDLRRFKAAGGKLIITQGWHDSGSPLPLNTIDYYEMVERAMGGRASTEDFVRLFMVPGRAHGPGGPGADSIDYLRHLEAWVEEGRAPDVMIGAHIDDESRSEAERWRQHISGPGKPDRVKFTRPHYPYPLRAQYTGNGSPDDYRNFRPTNAMTTAPPRGDESRYR